jgi:transposase
LVEAFQRLVRARETPALVAWLNAAETSDLREFREFAWGLRRDHAAVEAAVASEWSSGQVEGQVTRLKLVKRSMYGRAGFPLLRQRFLLAGSC